MPGVKVKRIVPNFELKNPGKAKEFYQDLLGLKPLMDMDWIITYGVRADSNTQINIMSKGGSKAPIPDISIEVDDVKSVYKKAKEDGFEIVYPLKKEPWGVQRFFVKDPCGKTINILSHLA